MSDYFDTIFDCLLTLVLLGAAAVVVLLEPLDGSAIGTAIVLPTLVLLPGYALVSLLYPELPADPATRENEGWSLTLLERFGLGIAGSVAITPLVALILNFTPYGVRARPIFVGIAGVTLLMTVGTVLRRFRIDSERRFRIPVGDWLVAPIGRYLTRSQGSRRQQHPFEAQNGRQQLLNVLIVVAVLTVFASVAYAAVGPTLPSQDGSYTELYVLDGEGEHLLGTEQSPYSGGAVETTIAIDNHETDETTYTLVLERQQVSTANNQTQVRQSTTLETIERTVGVDETTEIERSFESASQTRVQILLYKGAPPSNPSPENAYRTTRFWVGGNSTASGGN